MTPLVYTVAEVCQLLKLSRSAVYRQMLALAIERLITALPEPDLDHPRTYSLTASGPNGELFLVTDDESGITIGHAKKIGGPLTAPARLAAEEAK